MAKAELGTKRTCGKCGAKFYDMSRKPIICPKCSTEFVITVKAPRTPAPAPAAAPASKPAPKSEDVEVISLEDAEREESGKKKAGDPEVDVDDDFEIDDETLEDDEDDTFLEEEEEGDDDVSGLIGGSIEADDEEG